MFFYKSGLYISLISRLKLKIKINKIKIIIEIKLVKALIKIHSF
jgi:hypothetical protein